MTTSTLRRRTTVTDAAEFEKRKSALLAKLLPYLQNQRGFASHDLSRAGDAGDMIETTSWASDDDCRAYLRGGAAAMSATWLDAYLPTAPFPNGNWVRETASA